MVGWDIMRNSSDGKEDLRQEIHRDLQMLHGLPISEKIRSFNRHADRTPFRAALSKILAIL